MLTTNVASQVFTPDELAHGKIIWDAAIATDQDIGDTRNRLQHEIVDPVIDRIRSERRKLAGDIAMTKKFRRRRDEAP